MPRILIVEDNEDNMRLMAYLLRAAGHHLYTATSGAAGIELCEQEDPDLILMDIQMPVMDGFETVAKIRERRGGIGRTIVAVTAFAMVGDRERILSAGFDGCITKPISAPTFAEEVASYLSEPIGADSGG